MKAVIARAGSCSPELIDVPEPRRLAGDDVLCRTVELGICGTDRDILASGKPWVPQGCEHLILGHECLAQVLETGPDVTDLSAGDWVVPEVRRALTPGGARPDLLPPGRYVERGIFAQHGFGCPRFVDSEPHLIPVSPDLLHLAVLTEPVSITEKAVHEAMQLIAARRAPGDAKRERPRVLITGQGPIAFAAVLSTRSRGWECTMLGRDADSSPRAQFAQQLGADYRHWESMHLPAAELNEAAESDGFDLILECTGNEVAMVEVSPWLRSLGIMVWLGAPWEPREGQTWLSALMRDAILRNQIFMGTVNAARRDFVSAFDCLSWFDRQAVQLDRFITQRTSLEDSLGLYRSRPPQSIKAVVEFSV